MTNPYVISLQSLMEEAVATPERKNLTGNVSVIEDLFSEKNRTALKQHFPGVLAFLGFHPGVDSGIISYISSGSLSSDSGLNILVLFTLGTSATSPIELNDQAFNKWIKLDTSVQPSYTLIRSMFHDPATLVFPGVIFFEDFLQDQNPVYVPITDAANEDAVRKQMRQLFAIAEKAYAISEKGFLDHLAQTLQKEHLAYERGRDMSAKEWFVNAFRSIGKHFGDIVSVIQLFKP